MAEHPWGVGMPAWLKLHDFARMAHSAFGGRVVLVGSALRTKRPRDVDIRAELLDSEYAARIGRIHDCNLPGTGWAAHCRAWSALGRELVGRPIDFQVQPLGVALLYREEPRIVLVGAIDQEGDHP